MTRGGCLPIIKATITSKRSPDLIACLRKESKTMIYRRYFSEEFDEAGRLQAAKLEYPENFNFAYDVIEPLAERYPNKLAMLWRNDRGEERRLTFSDLHRLSNRAANVFRGWGLKKGDVLTVSLKTRYEYWYIALAAHKLGLLLSPVFHLLSEADLAYRLKVSGSKGVICVGEGETARRVQAAARETGIDRLYTVGGCIPGFSDFAQEVERASEDWVRAETLAHEPILLYFTSGTTGVPKGVLHDHAFTLGALMGARYMQDNGPDSLHFATGNTAWEVICGTKFYGQWLCESCLFVYDYDRFHADEVLAQLAQAGVTSMMAQPTVYRQMTDEGMDRYDLSSIRCFAVGGEKLTRDLADAVHRQTGQVLYEGYAQSEAGLIAANSKNMGRKENSVGKILPKYHVEILKEDGTFAKAGEQGELVLVAEGGRRPAGLLLGYFQDPEATAKLWDGNLFHTKDIAWKDEEGFLFYLGRSDGLIKTKGYRVSPVEIENALSHHPAVYECLVTGEEDRDLGQRICAYVRLAEGYAPSKALEEELLRFHNEDCSAYKKIRSLAFVTEIKRNANGKIIRDQFGT